MGRRKPGSPKALHRGHTVASADANVTLARPETRLRDGFAQRARRAPHPGCIGVDAKCTGLAEPSVTFKIGGLAGSMPAWMPVSLRTTNDSPLIRCESGSVGVGATRSARAWPTCARATVEARRTRNWWTPARHAPPSQPEGLQPCSALDSVVQRGPECYGAPSWRSLAAHGASATAGWRRAQGPF
jgi:hypothetical protein